MEDILALYETPYKASEPVLCLDEKPVQLLASTRAELRMSRGKVARFDYEYKRCGTANIFGIVEPRTGRHLTYATKTRKAPDFAHALELISKRYRRAKRIHLVMDNLNTHTRWSLTRTFGEKKGLKLWNRFVVHYTPVHASWLNQAEIAINLWSRECLGQRRIPYLDALQKQTDAWTRTADAERRTIRWTFTRKKARTKFRYLIHKHRSVH